MWLSILSLVALLTQSGCALPARTQPVAQPAVQYEPSTSTSTRTRPAWNPKPRSESPDLQNSFDSFYKHSQDYQDQLNQQQEKLKKVIPNKDDPQNPS